MAEKGGLKGDLARGKKIKGEILLTVAVAESSSREKAKALDEAEIELKKALTIAEEISAKPLQWQIHASLGKVYHEKGNPKMSSEQFTMAKEIIHKLASNIGDEKLKSTFLNSKQVRLVLK